MCGSSERLPKASSKGTMFWTTEKRGLKVQPINIQNKESRLSIFVLKTRDTSDFLAASSNYCELTRLNFAWDFNLDVIYCFSSETYRWHGCDGDEAVARVPPGCRDGRRGGRILAGGPLSARPKREPEKKGEASSSGPAGGADGGQGGGRRLEHQRRSLVRPNQTGREGDKHGGEDGSWLGLGWAAERRLTVPTDATGWQGEKGTTGGRGWRGSTRKSGKTKEEQERRVGVGWSGRGSRRLSGKQTARVSCCGDGRRLTGGASPVETRRDGGRSGGGGERQRLVRGGGRFETGEQRLAGEQGGRRSCGGGRRGGGAAMSRQRQLLRRPSRKERRGSSGVDKGSRRERV
ncbi:hypothetical protein BT93_K2238 [Corymbia citriodora subsp. variegata]|nr:hypothetical protein BT93_K2238 [Corymbia citriodora subsp. variegata]